MVQPLSAPETLTPETVHPSRAAPAIVASAAVVAALLMVGAAGLWVHYGTAVFFEMIKSGIAACI
jgi:branched-subunit amino acid transport protein AzlD